MQLFHPHVLQGWGGVLMQLHHPHALQGWAAGARARLLRRVGIRLKDAPEVYVKKVCLADSPPVLREHPILLNYRGNPCKKKIQAGAGASALSEGLPGQQRRVGSWASDMSEIEAVKLISNTKFEEVAAMPTLLGPSTVQVWSRDFGAFLVQNSAIALVVHNDEIEQKGTWFGEVLASRSCTSELGGRQAVELGAKDVVPKCFNLVVAHTAIHDGPTLFAVDVVAQEP
jgi:hypothetical protein